MREPEFTPSPGPEPEDDFDIDADLERWAADVDAGRRRIPDEVELAGPAASLSLGDAADVDPELLAAMCGPDGLGGEAVSAAYGQDLAADVLRPGPVLSALTEQAVACLPSLSDDQLIGALSAARRLENRTAYLQTMVIAEFARRRQSEREEARSRKVPQHCRPGQFPADELAAELVSTAHYADQRLWEATDLATRLPRTLAGMADGVIDAVRASIIWAYTCELTSRDASCADEVLAAAAPGLRPDQLGRKAAALEMRLDPEAVRRRRERARRNGQRVEVRHERSGNAILAGRELDPVTALAAKANIDALAVQLRNDGRDGSLQRLRALVMTELLQGRDPLVRLETVSAAPPAAAADWPDDPGFRDEDRDDERHEFDDERARSDFAVDPACASADDEENMSPLPRAQSGPGTPAGGLAPLPALINVLVPAGTLFGWSTAPAQASGWGLLDAGETKAFTAAASRSPRTRWCMTVVAPDGTALAHGCARGQHPWAPPPGGALAVSSRGQPPPAADGPGHAQAQLLSDFVRRLNITLRPVIRGGCRHEDAEDRYTPSRSLKHLVRARTATCTAPACNALAVHCDLDHTVAYPDGPTCQCNLAPKCRRHHRCKQAPGWAVEQPEPGVLRWTLPSGRGYTTVPARYEL